MKTIMVQMSDPQWTKEAIHIASALARSINGRVVLLRLVFANNPGLLGWAIASPTHAERHQIGECAAVAEDYGVQFCVQPMQYITLTDALAQAAEMFDAAFLFANIQQSRIPIWKHFELWSLKRQLDNCRLCTLDEKRPFSVNEPAFTAPDSETSQPAEMSRWFRDQILSRYGIVLGKGRF